MLIEKSDKIIESLRKRLDEIGIPNIDYSLGEMAKCHNCISLIQEGEKKWSVYHVEQNEPVKIAEFQYRVNACDFIFGIFKRRMMKQQETT